MFFHGYFFLKVDGEQFYGYKLLDIYVLQVHTSVAPNNKKSIIQQLI